jgi:sugar diacid utilization regulator
VKGLLVRLSRSDSEAEAALRVIEYFDALTLGRATVEALVRGAAALAECPVGVCVAGRPELRFDPTGVRLRDAAAPFPTSQLSLGNGTKVWLERPGGPGPLDPIIVERLMLSAQVLLPHESPQNEVRLADVALVDMVLSEREPPEERTKALRRLGLSPNGQLTVLAVAPTDRDADPAERALTLLARSRLTRAAHIASVERVAAVLLQASDRDALLVRMREVVREQPMEQRDKRPPLRVGVGHQLPAMDAHASWRSALVALRFAAIDSAEDAVADVEDLGPMLSLAQVPSITWEQDASVRALREMAGSPTGAEDLHVLRVFLRCGSLRQAAAALHMHHSSVAARLARLESRLGWTLTSTHDQFQARLALTGLLLLDTADPH